jgi:hypothetical protein
LSAVDFHLIALDLTTGELQASLGLHPGDLTRDDLSVCQTLADLAVAAGFDAVLGPSAALEGDTTFAVFDGAITTKSTVTRDLGARTPK